MYFDDDAVRLRKKPQMIYDYILLRSLQSHMKNVEYLRIIEFPFSTFVVGVSNETLDVCHSLDESTVNGVNL